MAEKGSNMLQHGVRSSLIWVAAAIVVCAKIGATLEVCSDLPSLLPVVLTLQAVIVAITGGAARGPWRANVWLWLFVGACVLSIATNTIAPVFSPWARLANLVLVLVLVSPLVTTPWLSLMRGRLLWLFVGACAAVTVVSLGMYLVDVARGAIKPEVAFAGLCQRPMTLSPLAGIAALGGLTLLMRSRRRGVQVAAAAMVLAGVWMSLQGGSRMVQAALVVAGAVAIALEGSRAVRRRVGAAIVVTAVCVGVLHTPALRIIEYKVDLGRENGSMTYSRDHQWADRCGEFADHPLTGVGFAAIERDTNPWSDREAVETRGNVEPGSSWLSVASSTGLCGVVTMAAFLCTVGACAVRVWRRRRRGGRRGAAAIMPSGQDGRTSRAAARRRGHDAIRTGGRTSRASLQQPCGEFDGAMALVLFVFTALVGVTEGFVLFAGSPLCVLFWLTTGVMAASGRR